MRCVLWGMLVGAVLVSGCRSRVQTAAQLEMPREDAVELGLPIEGAEVFVRREEISGSGLRPAQE